MIRIVILTLQHLVPASLSDARLAFEQANHLLTQSGKKPLFEVLFAGAQEEVQLDKGIYRIHPDVLLHEAPQPDLVLVPALSGDLLSTTFLNRDYAAWIARQYRQGAEIASLCSGAFLVAYAGILNGRQCTTHWQYVNEFRYFYPAVKLVAEKMLTDDNGIYSSGGGTAYWNLLLYLLEKFAGRDLAIQVAKHFVVDISRHRQSVFAVFNGMKDHQDDVVLQAQEYIEAHYSERLPVATLAARFNTGRRTFERRFRKATHITVTEYIQRVKIEAAKKQLELGRKSITEIMYEIGYADLKTFRDLFRKYTGITALEYRSKYSGRTSKAG